MSWAQSLDECRDASDYAYCTCAVYSCGYSQLNREHISIALLKSGEAETDCSYGVNWWLWMGGLVDACIGFATRDGTELDYLQSQGFTMLNPRNAEPQRNDVLWKYGHTALYIGDGMQAEALRTENYDAGWNGSEPGDQDGGETVVRPYPSGSKWELILRPPVQEQPEPEVPEQTEEEIIKEMSAMGSMCIINVVNDHRIMQGDNRTAMLKGGWQVLWSAEGGFEYISNGDSIKYLNEIRENDGLPPLKQFESSKEAPIAQRLYEITFMSGQNSVLKERWPHQPKE